MLLACGAAMLLSGCVYETRSVLSKEARVEQEMAVKDFVAIDISGSPTVTYEQGDSVRIVVSGPESQVKNISVYADGGRLKVTPKQKNSLLKMNSVSEVTVHVVSPDLVGVTLSGSGDFVCNTPLDTDTLTLLLRGSGDISIASVVCDRLIAELLGSGDIDVKQAQTQLASFSLTGSGDIDAKLRNTTRTDISLVGSGDIDIAFDKCREVDCQLRGSGDIELSGEIEHIKEQKSGSGDIDKGKLTLIR